MPVGFGTAGALTLLTSLKARANAASAAGAVLPDGVSSLCGQTGRASGQGGSAGAARGHAHDGVQTLPEVGPLGGVLPKAP